MNWGIGMGRLRRGAPCLLFAVMLTLLRPAIAAEPVVVDPLGDATPERCEPVAGTCHRVVSGDSQPAADIVSVHVVRVDTSLGIEVGFADIDRPIPTIGPETGLIQTTVSFRLGGRNDRRWASVWLSVSRDFAGNLTSPNASITVSTYGGNDDELASDVAGTASVDSDSNRLRIVASLEDLQRTVEKLCPGCASLTPGSALSSFFAHSSAYSYIKGPLAVGVETVARDTGWPHDRSYTM